MSSRNAVGLRLVVEWGKMSEKIKNAWCRTSRDLKIPKHIQPKENSMGSGVDGVWHIFWAVSAQNSDGNLCLPAFNYNWNDNRQRKLNLYNVSNDFNQRCGWLVLRQHFNFPCYLTRVFLLVDLTTRQSFYQSLPVVVIGQNIFYYLARLFPKVVG